MNNQELKNTLIVTRRPREDNEFLFNYNSNIENADQVFNYIETITNISIKRIDRDELPLNQGIVGWRVIKNG